MGEDDNQVLAAHTKKQKFKKEDHSHKKPQKYHQTHKSQKDYSSIKCHSYQKMGHSARNCPHAKDQVKKGKKKRYHAHTTKDNEHVQKRARQDDTSEEEYVLTSAFVETVTHGSDT